jgi:hypothetical protein
VSQSLMGYMTATLETTMTNVIAKIGNHRRCSGHVGKAAGFEFVIDDIVSWRLSAISKN